jgi:galactokinase
VTADRARARFREVFGYDAAGVAYAPGRVNLVGEHTDYNDGFVLPMAIERGIALAFAPRPDDGLRVHSAAVPQTRELQLSRLRQRVSVEPERHGQRSGWFGYVAGVAWAMLGAGMSLRGADVAFISDLPIGAGLSSSAALEIGIARALTAASGLDWDPKTAAMLSLRAEREFAGVDCGIMDQLVVAAAREGHALLIDCRSLDTRDVLVPEGIAVVILDSGVRRDLAASAYNDRHAACTRVVEAVRSKHADVLALRDVDLEMLESVRDGLRPDDYRRARHVIEENPRPAALSAALATGDLASAGRTMADSHASLRDWYEVSTTELNALADAAASSPGCYGARLTGAGFGGCVVALVDVGRVDALIAEVTDKYQEQTGRVLSAIVSGASPAARLLD